MLTTAAAAELKVPAFTAYTLPDANGARISERGGVRNWTDPALSVNWYGQINTPGSLTAKLTLRLPEGAESKLKLTVAGTSHEATARGAKESVTVDFGSFEVAQAGYQRFQLE